MKKRTVTTIETHQVVVVMRPEGAADSWCPSCPKQVPARDRIGVINIAGEPKTWLTRTFDDAGIDLSQFTEPPTSSR